MQEEEKICREELVLEKVSVADFPGLYKLIEGDFPREERVPLGKLTRALKKGLIQACYLEDGNERYAYLVYQILPEEGICHLLYLAVLPPYRGKGLGAALLARAMALPGSLFLEVDDPAAAEDSGARKTREGRIAFYRRCGLELIPGVTMRFYGVDMKLMGETALLDNAKERDWQALCRRLYNRLSPLPLVGFFIRQF